MLDKLLDYQYRLNAFNGSAIVEVYRKKGFFLGLAGTAAKALLPLAGFYGLSKGMTTEGSMKDKIMAGAQEGINQVVNPSNIASNTLVWGAPGYALGWAKAPGIVKMPLGMYGGMKTTEAVSPVLNIPAEEGEEDKNPFSLG